MNNNASEGELAELALAVYLEELAKDRRALWIGSSSVAAERLASTARSVDHVSPEARARGTRRGGRINPRRWPGDDDDGSWDLIVAPDIGAAGLADPESLTKLSRWIAEGGVLVAGNPEPDGPDGHPAALPYEAFFNLLDGGFESVRLIGQANFRGFSVVDLDPPGDEPEVTFDGSLLEGRGAPAARYVALCAAEDIVLDAYAVIQTPAPAPRPSEAPSPAAPRRDPRVRELEARLREQQDALDASQVHAEELERALDQAKSRVSRAAPEGENGASAEEFVRLETALRETGRELSLAKLELERRGVLARDLIEELAEARGAASVATTLPAPRRAAPEPDDALANTVHLAPDALARALERKTSAEATNAELEFRVDELTGALEVAERRAAMQLEEQLRVEAALRGTVRGLNARLAELTELHQQAQARALLLEEDVPGQRARERALERELAKAKEAFELELSRAHAAERAAAEQSDVVRALAACEAERDLLQQALERAKAEGAPSGDAGSDEASFIQRIAELAAEASDARAELEQALAKRGELEARVEAHDQIEAALRGEKAGLELRLADREEAVRELAGHAPPESLRREIEALENALAAASRDGEALEQAREQLGAARAELQTLSEALERAEQRAAHATQVELELQAARAGAAELDALRAELDRRDQAEAEASRAPRAALEAARAEVAELTSRMAARDALIARLQRGAGGDSESTERAEEQLEQARIRLKALEERAKATELASEVGFEEANRAAESLRAELEAAHRERDEARAALTEARDVLRELDGEIAERSASEGLDDPTETSRLRAMLEAAKAEAEDRDVMLRSLTAQLQERDDRIRALERASGVDVGADEPAALRTKVLELEERAARLEDELAHEREARRDAERR